ncbi:MAG TPA: sigma-70 family RNA polymerase sigma factor, partial [Thermoleophilaceae bacterium]|nr:sigma-70 family RNA polymerase sigma factor [Thermoleophilaceae bacterium]
MGERGERSSRPSAARFVERHGDALLATARRYTATPEDAEDAYQRGLEILLAKSPSVPEEELLPWMRTVVKHEAFAIWRGRTRTVPASDEALEQAGSAEPAPDEQLLHYERLRVGAEAIGRLKPQEVRCLLLRAEGLSYQEICEETGWTYTKVNRCITEGRRSFLARVAGIESGSECQRLEPLLSTLADGEATAGDMAVLRPHLRSCPACRATLRRFRDVPRRIAVLAPVAIVFAPRREDSEWPRWLQSLGGWVEDRAALVAVKVQAAFEGSSSGKLAAAAASAVAIAGGTVAVLEENPIEPPPAIAAPPEPESERIAPVALDAAPPPSVERPAPIGAPPVPA